MKSIDIKFSNLKSMFDYQIWFMKIWLPFGFWKGYYNFLKFSSIVMIKTLTNCLIRKTASRNSPNSRWLSNPGEQWSDFPIWRKTYEPLLYITLVHFLFTTFSTLDVFIISLTFTFLIWQERDFGPIFKVLRILQITKPIQWKGQLSLNFWLVQHHYLLYC